MNLISIYRIAKEPGRNGVAGWTGHIYVTASGGLKKLGYTVERADTIIPDGVFPIGIHNPSPGSHFRVPKLQILIPHYTNILIHEANYPDQLLGCIAAGGEDLPGAGIGHSLPVVTWLENLVMPQLRAGVAGMSWWCAIHQLPAQ